MRHLLRNQTLLRSYGAGEGPGLRRKQGTIPGLATWLGHAVLRSREMLSSQQRRFLESDEACGHMGTLCGHGESAGVGELTLGLGGGCPATTSVPHTSETAIWLQLMLDLGSQEEMWVPSLGREDPLEEGMATQSSILAWRIPWMEEPGGLRPIGSQRVRHA